MDANRLRAILLKLQDRLSNDDRKGLHFFLGNDVPRRIRDDPSLDGTLSLLESLFERDKINEKDFTFLINAFDEIHCHDAARSLNGYVTQKRSDGLNQSMGSLAMIMPLTTNEMLQYEDDDKVAPNLALKIRINPVVGINVNINQIATTISDQQTRRPESNRKLQVSIPIDIWKARYEITAGPVQNGVTVAGGHGKGDATHQLSWPHGLFVDGEGAVFIADWGNNRIVEWKRGDTSGTVLVGGNGKGDRPDQLNEPTDVIVDKETDSLIICDRRNRRVTRWPHRSGNRSGETIIDNIACVGLAMDDEGFLYITDREKHEVRRYRPGETSGTVVAGGNGQGAGFHQLHHPHYVCIDGENVLYVSDNGNHRVMKWVKDAKEGIVVAGGRGEGKSLTQLSYPNGVVVDLEGNIYVVDSRNHRVMRWSRGASEGTVVMGENGRGEGANQFNGPTGLSFDRRSHFYVADWQNNRVQRFEISK